MTQANNTNTGMENQSQNRSEDMSHVRGVKSEVSTVPCLHCTGRQYQLNVFDVHFRKTFLRGIIRDAKVRH